jgi:hypothetical protein
MIARLFIALAFGAAATTVLLAQPLYLGEQEIDTSDRAALSALIDHCAALADEASAPQPATGPVAGADADTLASETATELGSMTGTGAEGDDGPGESLAAGGGNGTQAVPRADDDGRDAEPGSYSGPVDMDALASSDDEAQAAGEGTGSGVPTSGADGEDDNNEEGSLPSLDQISLEMCKAAGIVF